MLNNKIDIRVYYEDTDAGGIVYYSNYLKFTERCRTELLRDLGISQSNLNEKFGIKFIVHSLSIKYMNPAFLDDLLTIETNINKKITIPIFSLRTNLVFPTVFSIFFWKIL